MRKVVLAVAMLLLLATFQAKAVPITKGVELKDTYRQNEKLEVIATIVNYDNKTLILTLFNLTIVRAKPSGRTVKPAYNWTKNLDVKLEPNQVFTIRVVIDLSKLSPDKYNLTAYFEGKYEGVLTDKYYVYENYQFQLLPSVQIPGAVYAVIAIMSAIIVVYVGYGVAGRLRR